MLCELPLNTPERDVLAPNSTGTLMLFFLPIFSLFLDLGLSHQSIQDPAILDSLLMLSRNVTYVEWTQPQVLNIVALSIFCFGNGRGMDMKGNSSKESYI